MLQSIRMECNNVVILSLSISIQHLDVILTLRMTDTGVWVLTELRALRRGEKRQKIIRRVVHGESQCHVLAWAAELEDAIQTYECIENFSSRIFPVQP